MKHELLMKFARDFGYKSIKEEGLCFGFSSMWIQAVVCGEQERINFENRFKFLNENYAKDPEKLQSDIAKVRELKKRPPHEQPELTEEQQILLEIPPFFEGVACYLHPHIIEEMVGHSRFKQRNVIELSEYLQSKALEKAQGLRQVFRANDQYNQEELIEYLSELSTQLKNREDVAINLGANKHSVAIRVKKNGRFQLVDTNHLDEMDKEYTSEELAKKLNSSFMNESDSDWLLGPKPLVMRTAIYTNNAAAPLDLDYLRKKTILRNLVTDKKGYSILQNAVCLDDVETLKRIDFNYIDINVETQRFTPLLLAVEWSNKAAQFLLDQDKKYGLNVNKPYFFPPLCKAISIGNFEIARKIIAHPSFNPQQSDEAGKSPLYYLIQDQIFDEEAKKIAQELINKGADLNQKDKNGITPLRLAIDFNLPEVVEFLLKNPKIDVNKTDDVPPLFKSIILEKWEQARSIINHPSFDPLKRDQLGNNALHHLMDPYRFTKDTLALAQELIDKGVDLNQKNHLGLRPLELALEQHNPEVLFLLERTKLSREDFKSDSPLMKLISEYPNREIQLTFVKKALTLYIEERQQGSDYLNPFNWSFGGIHKDKKINAARALLNEEKYVEINYQEAIGEGVLASLYALYKKAKSKPPSQSPSLSFFALPKNEPQTSNLVEPVSYTVSSTKALQKDLLYVFLEDYRNWTGFEPLKTEKGMAVNFENPIDALVFFRKEAGNSQAFDVICSENNHRVYSDGKGLFLQGTREQLENYFLNPEHYLRKEDGNLEEIRASDIKLS